MSEAKPNTHSQTNYERLHGVPEQLDEATLWVRQGYVDVNWLEKMAAGTCEGHKRDIGRLAMLGLLATPSNYKALQEVDPTLQSTYHVADSMGIYHKELERNEQGAVVAVRPGMTPEQFVDAGGPRTHLLDPEQWVVATESLYDHFSMGILRDDLIALYEGEAVGRERMTAFGKNEITVLDWSVSLLASSVRR